MGARRALASVAAALRSAPAPRRGRCAGLELAQVSEPWREPALPPVWRMWTRCYDAFPPYVVLSSPSVTEREIRVYRLDPRDGFEVIFRLLERGDC